jgi:hypothetical protein
MRPQGALRACCDIPEVNPLIHFRDPSGSDAISQIPCKSAQRILSEVGLQTVTGICKTPSEGLIIPYFEPIRICRTLAIHDRGFEGPAAA